MKKHIWFLVLVLAIWGCFSQPVEPQLEISGEVAKETYDNLGWGGGLASRVAYQVTITVKNHGPGFFCDTVLGSFIPAHGKPLDCLSVRADASDPSGQKKIPWVFPEGESLEFEFTTNGYTDMLLIDCGDRPLEFRLRLGVTGRNQAIAYTADLPSLKSLPVFEPVNPDPQNIQPLTLQKISS